VAHAFDNKWLWAPYALLALALLAYIGYFVIYVDYAAALMRFPFDYDQGEGFELVDTLLFSRGQWPYQDIETYPFYSSNYPPIFHLLAVPLVWLFGPEYWTGRLLSFVGTLITASAIGYAVWRGTRRWWVASFSGLAFLASNYVYHVGPLFRQHMFMVMFETLAVVALTVLIEREEASNSRNRRGLLVVMLLLLLAGYTKQLAYATVAAVFLFLFLRQWRRSIVWAVGFATVTAAIFFLIDLATNGHWLTNTVTANVNPFIPGQAVGLYRQWISLHIVLTASAVVMVAYQLYFERLSLYAVWFVVAAVNGATAGKWGAGESYFATAIAASAILMGLLFGSITNAAEKRGPRWQAFTIAVVAVLLLLQAERVFHMRTDRAWLNTVAARLGQPTETLVAPQTSCSAPRPVQPVSYVDSAGVGLLGRPPTERDTMAGQVIVDLVGSGGTAAFSEEAGFNLRLGRDVVTNPTQLLNLYNNNQVDIDNMITMLNDRYFDTVVLRAQFYPPPVLEAIGRNYQTVHLEEMNGFVYCVLTPRETVHER